jgi:periplasmic divalent cation tolerance protein
MQENQIVVFCTAPNRETGERIARALVQERLAACVNLLPGLVSTYRWQGKVEQAAECLLLIKTAQSRFDTLRERIKSLHPYDVPEIIAMPISQGDTQYLKWITENTQ